MADLIVDENRAAVLKELSLNLVSISLNRRQLCDIELITNGAYAPLNGFMTQADFQSVLDRMRLQTGEIWPLPICLDVSRTIADRIEAGQSVALRDPEGFMLAIMHVSDKWDVDIDLEISAIFRDGPKNIGAHKELDPPLGDVYIGGKIEAVHLPIHYDFQQVRQSPNEVKALFKKLGWRQIIGYQTRHPIHRAQYELITRGMQKANANLLLLPVTGNARMGDFDHFTRIRCYKSIESHFPPGAVLLSLLPYSPRAAGLRELLLKTIISKNYGCTHSLIGPGYVRNLDGMSEIPLIERSELLEKANETGKEIGIELVWLDEMVYLTDEDEFCPRNEVKSHAPFRTFSNRDIQDRIKRGRRLPHWVTFPEVIEELRKSFPEPSRQGITVFFTGLSGSGKSTLAKVLYSKILEIGSRPVTLLDGDIVRRNLSSELSFSKEHRDINVRRIGFVAEEITKNRGVAICAPIAPYTETRRQIRQAIESHGGFIEVHVATPLEVCEQRDRKGMYAKARAGLIKDFTGIDDPYETPELPEVKIDTSELSPEEAVQQILLYLGQRGFI